MIPRLASPSICVIDDEKADYEPILKALSKLGLAHTHVNGRNPSKLRPLNGIRLVFTDLHLANHIGKDAASYTANVFCKLFPEGTGPLVVIIWSKYAEDPAGDVNLPPNDQPTEADLFKEAVFGAIPAFKESLVFCEMKKPKPRNRPNGTKWVTKLKKDIQKELDKVSAFDVLWSWESIVRDAAVKLTDSLTALALKHGPAKDEETGAAILLHDRLQLTLRLLVHEQGGPDCNSATCARHLVSILGQTLADQLEHSDSLKNLAKHGPWLSDFAKLPKTNSIAPSLNSLLVTSAPSERGLPFVPGTVYRVKKESRFESVFGIKTGELVNAGYRKPDLEGTGFSRAEWKANAKPIVIEISPTCDVHQGNRRNSLLIAGLILPAAARENAKRDGAFELLPNFALRWPMDDFPEQDVFLMFCGRFKATTKPQQEPRWLSAWFRLRELPTAALRNWHSSQASRVGYVSLR